MNYYDTVYGNGQKQESAVAMDKQNDSGERIYVISCRDGDSHILNLIQDVKKSSDGGHSFDVVVDPDKDEKGNKHFVDGDGSDQIHSITSTNADLDLRKVLLSGIKDISCVAGSAIADPSYPDRNLEDPVEALKKIESKCNTLLSGNGISFGWGIKDALVTLIKNTKNGIKNCDNPPRPEWTPKEELEFILWSLKKHYGELVESQQKDTDAVAPAPEETVVDKEQ